MERATCQGFAAAGIAAGIKKNGALDLGLIASRVPAAVAGVFTRNRVQAAPVIIDRDRVASGLCRAVIVNSGNANCCTGAAGIQDAMAATAMVAKRLNIPEAQVLVSSTGVIGQPLPMGRIGTAVPTLIDALRPEGFPDFSRAIMTTDTVPKMVVRNASIDGQSFTVIAAAKGVGMIRPDMATMLCFVCTDAGADPSTLQAVLTRATARSFNRITIDGDMSTNDTVLLLANGLSAVRIDAEPQRGAFQDILDAVLLDLARQLVRDGEGATKLVDIVVRGAASDADARCVADTVAGSSLVKTAFFGEDANWGRIIGAAGRAGVPLTPERVDIFFDTVQMVDNGVGCGDAAEAAATAVLKKPEFTVTIDLNLGQGSASVITCDFSVEYVRINADYRS